MLHLLSEEQIAEDSISEYFDDLYRIVCVSEKPANAGRNATLVKTTYIVDWEQLVHLLEDYEGFGEDIIEMKAVTGEEARLHRRSGGSALPIAHA
jgi:ADP-glucose pyrophosphorylase